MLYKKVEGKIVYFFLKYTRKWFDDISELMRGLETF